MVTETKRQKVADDELNRRAMSVKRIILDYPGSSAKKIGSMLGSVPAREVRDRIRRLRQLGEPILAGPNGQGYFHLDSLQDGRERARFVKAHDMRSRAYMRDYATLVRQVGEMTGEEIATHAVLDILVPAEAGEADARRPSTVQDLAALPPARRAGVLSLLETFLAGIAADPEAFRHERAALSRQFSGVFLTDDQAEKLRAARRMLDEAGV